MRSFISLSFVCSLLVISSLANAALPQCPSAGQLHGMTLTNVDRDKDGYMAYSMNPLYANNNLWLVGVTGIKIGNTPSTALRQGNQAIKNTGQLVVSEYWPEEGIMACGYSINNSQLIAFAFAEASSTMKKREAGSIDAPKAPAASTIQNRTPA